ncbi:ArsR/SmtB family transcription factor [Streptacidiphilus cavernicola]|uniref:ArsR/SmtB family transcription factor n=1 Tax=Streptacidiphilus cavernicola TaxID=3342716 RepID=A0ABV6W289_9ACTN
MGLWLVDADTLARSSFVVSPLVETVACLTTLAVRRPPHPGVRPWLDRHLPDYDERLRADPVTALLVEAALQPRWIADFLAPVPPHPQSLTFRQELGRIRGASPDTVLADLDTATGGRLPAALARHRDELPGRAADLLEWVWSSTLQPLWPRRRRLFEADVLSRTGQLSSGGWAAALDRMRPGMRWLGDGRLQINRTDNPPRDLSGARLVFVPASVHRGWVSWDEPHHYAVVYPCSGPLAEPAAPAAPEALSRLLGPGRAAVLVLLAAPRSTTQLVALTGQGLGSVGRHLKVLLDAGLVDRRRAGRSVLYQRTPAGDVLTGAAPKSTSPGPVDDIA